MLSHIYLPFAIGLNVIKGKIRTFFKCIYYKAYSIARIIPH